jgi:hypothetical protein
MVYGVYNDLLVITWNGCVSYHLLVNSASFFFLPTFSQAGNASVRTNNADGRWSALITSAQLQRFVVVTTVGNPGFPRQEING